ncbi:hypothetical protein H7J74_25620 [Mycobacterium angelicum]|nr:hypothetical protein [Mycobacterium angelicum]
MSGSARPVVRAVWLSRRFGGDAVGAVLGAGAAALRHHRGAFGAVAGGGVGVGQGDLGGGGTQAGKQQGAAGGGYVGVPGGGGQDQGGVAQLLFGPAPEGFDQVMGAAVASTSTS